jgi:putative SOS response-associated peptidase YedK
MAGLWSRWKNPKTGEWERTFAVVTGEANGVMQPVHDRQPVILEPRDYAEYLAEAQRAPTHLLRILPEDEMNSQRVADDCEPGEQGMLFGE